MNSPLFPRLTAAQRLVALLCAFTVGALGILAASPELHAELHDDCCEAEHSCAITLFSHAVDAPAAIELNIEPAVFRPGKIATEQRVGIRTCERRFPPGRGPPAGLISV